MKIYRVIHGPLKVGAGSSMLLTTSQVADRERTLTRQQLCGDAHLIEAKELQTFKAGELIGLREYPQGSGHLVHEVTTAEPGSQESVLLSAAALAPF